MNEIVRPLLYMGISQSHQPHICFEATIRGNTAEPISTLQHCGAFPTSRSFYPTLHSVGTNWGRPTTRSASCAENIAQSGFPPWSCGSRIVVLAHPPRRSCHCLPGKSLTAAATLHEDARTRGHGQGRCVSLSQHGCIRGDTQIRFRNEFSYECLE